MTSKVSLGDIPLPSGAELLFHSPQMTGLDAINIAKVVTGICIVILAATKGTNLRQALYCGLHGSYLIWWMTEQWLFDTFSTRFPKPLADPGELAFIILLVGFMYSIAAFNCWRNKKEISPMTVVLCVVLYGLGSMLNVMADTHLYATKAAMAAAGTKALVTNGVFRLARNPNYLGDYMRYGSFCLCSGMKTSWLLLLFPIGINFDSLRQADQKGGMASKYGEAFTQWVENTNLMVPLPTESSTLVCIGVVFMVWAMTYFLFAALSGKGKAAGKAQKTKKN